MGKEIVGSKDFQLRLFAADVLRELSLANTDLSLFWPPAIEPPQYPDHFKSFTADERWLRGVARTFCEGNVPDLGEDDR